METKVVTILNEMVEYLSLAQMKKLQEVLLNAFSFASAEKMKKQRVFSHYL